MLDSPANDELAEAEQAAIDHMNADHSDAIDVYARAFAKADETAAGRSSASTPKASISLRATTAGGSSSPNRWPAQRELRQTLVGLAQQGRRSIAQPPD